MKRFLLLSAFFLLPFISFAQKPLVGIVGCRSNGSTYVEDCLYDAVVAAGGVPLILPSLSGAAARSGIVKHLDGLLCPESESSEKASADKMYVEQALSCGIPVMGICLGNKSDLRPSASIFKEFVSSCPVKDKAAGLKGLTGITTSYNHSGSSQSSAVPESVVRAGGLPVLLPRFLDGSVADETVSHLDGIILSGGEDVDPQWYGETVTADNVAINATRDSSEMFIISAALKHRLRIMGICRGMQILNVALGGTLVQDIPTQWSGSFNHRISGGGLHELVVIADRDVWAVLKASGCKVNSRHHQSVKCIAPGCEVTAKATDGVVEAYDCPERRVIGVQFHPENFACDGKEPYLRIFKAFFTL